MKIAFVTNTCWNIYNFREGLAKHFIQRGDEVIALAPTDQYTQSIKEWGLQHFHTPLDQTGTNPIKDLAYLNHLRRILKKEQPDVALSFTIKCNIYSSLLWRTTGVPTICNVSGLGTVFLVRGWLGKMAMALYKLAFRYSQHVFFQNEDDKALFLDHISLNEQRIELLPGSGIDLQKFKVVPLELGNETRFLMIARLIEEKGVREFVEAAVSLKGNPKARFTLVGDLDENHARSIPKEELEGWIGQDIIEYIPHTTDIKSIINKSEIVVLPSYREGTPRTLLESAAMGRPLLATNVPGCKEVVVDGFNGFLFEAKNASSLIDKIKLYMAMSNDEKQLMAKNSRKLVEDRFDENYVIQAYVEVISQIVDN